MVLIGLYKGPMPQLPLNLIPAQNVTIKGLLTGNKTMLQELVTLVAQKRVSSTKIVLILNKIFIMGSKKCSIYVVYTSHAVET